MAIGQITFSNSALSVIKLRFCLPLSGFFVLFLNWSTSPSGQEVSSGAFEDHPQPPIRICTEPPWQLICRASPISFPNQVQLEPCSLPQRHGITLDQNFFKNTHFGVFFSRWKSGPIPQTFPCWYMVSWTSPHTLFFPLGEVRWLAQDPTAG